MPAKNTKSATKDAIAMLEEDHERVRGLLEELEETTTRGVKKRAELLGKIALEIRTHAKLEEEIFYTAFEGVAKTQEDRKLFLEAAEEHGLVDIVLPALEELDPASEVFGAKAKVLKDLIEHHAEEEETHMFPRSKKLFSREDLMALGERMRERKPELQKAGASERAGSRAERAERDEDAGAEPKEGSEPAESQRAVRRTGA